MRLRFLYTASRLRDSRASRATPVTSGAPCSFHNTVLSTLKIQETSQQSQPSSVALVTILHTSLLNDSPPKGTELQQVSVLLNRLLSENTLLHFAVICADLILQSDLTRCLISNLSTFLLKNDNVRCPHIFVLQNIQKSLESEVLITRFRGHVLFRNINICRSCNHSIMSTENIFHAVVIHGIAFLRASSEARIA